MLLSDATLAGGPCQPVLSYASFVSMGLVSESSFLGSVAT